MILQAAAEAFASQGFDAAKMEGIASDAGTSIGSVYQFFANKRALFRAVAERCIERARQTFAEQLTPETMRRPWPELVDDMVDTFAKLQKQDAGYRALISNIALYEEFAEADQELLDDFVTSTTALLGTWAPKIDAERRKVVATVIVNGISGLLIAGSRFDAKTFEAMLQEIKLMVRRYLAPELDPAHAAALES